MSFKPQSFSGDNSYVPHLKSGCSYPFVLPEDEDRMLRVEWRDEGEEFFKKFITNRKRPQDNKKNESNSPLAKLKHLQSLSDPFGFTQQKKLSIHDTPPLLKFTPIVWKKSPTPPPKRSPRTDFTVLLRWPWPPKEVDKADSKTTDQRTTAADADVVVDDFDDSLFEHPSFLATLDKIDRESQTKRYTAAKVTTGKHDLKAGPSSSTARSTTPVMTLDNWDDDSPFNRPSFLAQVDEICAKYATSKKDTDWDQCSEPSHNFTSTPRPLCASTPVCPTMSGRRRLRLPPSSATRHGRLGRVLDFDLDDDGYDAAAPTLAPRSNGTASAEL